MDTDNTRLVTIDAAVELVREETGIPITKSRIHKDSAKGVAPPPDAIYGRRYLWRPEKIELLADVDLQVVPEAAYTVTELDLALQSELFLGQQLRAAKRKIDSLEAEIEELKAERDRLRAQIADLQAAPANGATAPPANADDLDIPECLRREPKAAAS
jgi:hypothetical protein